jgi:PAS domain S-box-containing protein
MQQDPPKADQNEVLVTSRGLVIVKVRGYQTTEGLRKLTKELISHADQLNERNKKMLLYFDITSLAVTDGGNETRIEGKRMLSQIPAAAIAIVGNGVMGTTLLYLFRVAGVSDKAKFFTNEKKARDWLDSFSHPKRKPLNIGLAAGIALCLIGVTALVGWQINNIYLMSWLSTLRPMNPMSAVGVIAIGVAFIGYWLHKVTLLRWLAVGGILLGVMALLPVPIDHILFGAKVTAVGTHGQIADSAAICFIAVGIVGLILDRKLRWVRIAEYVSASVILALALFNIFGQLYAHDYIYNMSSNFVMAYNLAVAFAITAGVFFVLVTYHQLDKNILYQLNRATWLILFSLLVLQGVTYAAWRQAVARNESDTRHALTLRMDNVRAVTEGRLRTYASSLSGFSGLFAASDYVSQEEFAHYYNSLNLSKNAPGLQSIIYITAVNDKDINSYLAMQRKNNNGVPATISRKTTQQNHYVLTYTATGSSPSIGLDLTSIPGREALYTEALNTKDIYGSGTVTVPGVTGTSKPYKGFFMITPVSSPLQPKGIVNAVLKYEVFFDNLFGDTGLADNVDIKITDGTNGSTVFESYNRAQKESYTNVESLPIANRTWQVAITADKSFGIGESQTRLPMVMIFVGQAFSLFLLLLFLSQWRARKQALDLADTITQDLQVERNKAVANDRNQRAILASIGDGVFAVDTHERLTLLNPAAQEISGVLEEDSLGKPYGEVLRFELEHSGKVNDQFIKKALKGQLASMSNHTVLVREDGKQVPVADSAAPIHDARGKVIGAIVVFRDVSTDYELEKAKSEFVSLASHQLRTPLSAVNWYGEMLLNGDAGKLNKGQHEYIKEIFEGSQRMVELVNSLLDVSRLEVGKLANQPVPTSMADLINSLEKELETSVQAKKLHITKDIEPIAKINADPKQLRMVVQNLMSNAAKYTSDKGSISIVLREAKPKDLRTAGLHTTEPHLLFEVKDDGYGIPKNEQAKIFGKLFRADNVRSLDVEGTGLGLYIVKGVVKKMGGQVWFDSEEGVGTTFFVVLPFNPKHGK